MPGKRGLETYQEVREIAPNLPVVMVTKSEEDATLREALGANIRDYLVKPINPRQVLTVITRHSRGAAHPPAGDRARASSSGSARSRSSAGASSTGAAGWIATSS